MSLIFAWTSIAQASEITPDRVVKLVNQDRAMQGLQPLQFNDTLAQAAQAKADDMVKNTYFSHTSPSGVTPWDWIQKSGYDYRFAGENLAIRFTDAEDQERAWMASVKHKENILNLKYRDIGVAVEKTVRDGQEMIIVVQMFGVPFGSVVTVAQETDLTLENPHNVLIPSTSIASQDVSKTTYAPEPGRLYFGGWEIWMQWIGFTMVLLIAYTGFLFTIMKKRVFTNRQLHDRTLL